jgi:predicted RNA-binding Zn ribbon-like protein
MDAGWRWSRIGGHLALDLCNTVSWRLDPTRTTERLTEPADVTEWFRAMTGSGPSAPDRETLRSVRRLRDTTTRLIDDHLDRRIPAGEDMRTVRDAWSAALSIADIAPTLPLTPTITPVRASLLAPHLALAVAELLHRPDLTNLRRCDGPGCGWLFLDTTRNHSRRWCDSLDCGNRARVRSYAKRRRLH